jgi:hypothetical protein
MAILILPLLELHNFMIYLVVMNVTTHLNSCNKQISEDEPYRNTANVTTFDEEDDKEENKLTRYNHQQ